MKGDANPYNVKPVQIIQILFGILSNQEVPIKVIEIVYNSNPKTFYNLGGKFKKGKVKLVITYVNPLKANINPIVCQSKLGYKLCSTSGKNPI